LSPAAESRLPSYSLNPINFPSELEIARLRIAEIGKFYTRIEGNTGASKTMSA
jgi:hypothetical protein